VHIQAENGSPVGEYNYGVLLSNDPDPKKAIRARYWLKLAEKHGEPLATGVLKELEKAGK
jgi:hypothetical protein